MSLRSEGGWRARAGRERGRKGKGKGVELCGLELFGRRKRIFAEDQEAEPDAHLFAGVRTQPRAHPWQSHAPTLSTGSLRLEDAEDAPALTPGDIARLAAEHFQPVKGTRPVTDREAFGAEGEEREEEGFGEFVQHSTANVPSRGGFPSSGLTRSRPHVPVPPPTPTTSTQPAAPSAQLSPKPQPQPQPPRQPPRQRRGSTQAEEDDPEGDFGSLYSRSRRSRPGSQREDGSSSTPSLSSRSSRTRSAPSAVHQLRKAGSGNGTSSRGPKPTHRSSIGREGEAAVGEFEGWIGSGEGGDLLPLQAGKAWAD
ncbi:hypothetical protein DACRYDRAFT_23955 [Dacryopinax primogenitus]|uniref:Uncharacterized protein n=1 Tax=Dacryopinax primogenitus (strain DJM 731) TaxID=1858805 RepID=M5G6N8_DACPD|nr:uncharacterized protein DACRYDRAFT_23955 [Dacryopinax primogenitus]EJT99427.1 hypothetical protein DACRYDRAFT_23955 [Dacryopinax primogenitus]